MISPQKIKELCDNWCNAALQAGGGIAIGGQSEQYRLLRNGLQFHELDFDQLVAAIDGLTKVLLLPGLNTIVDQDHFGLWSWCAEVILYRETNFFDHQEREIRNLFETCIRASLVHCKEPVANHEEWQRQVDIDQQIPHNSKQFIQESSLVLAYLTFPLLEAMTKKICNNYVNMNGNVIKKFSVTNKFGGLREYDPNGKWNQKQCSSLRDLLSLLYNNISSNKLRKAIDEFRSHISTLDNSQDPFDIVYDWRNQSLHGSTSFQTIGGTLLNLVILIAIHQLSDKYNSLRVKVLNNCRRTVQMGYKTPWSFYPPY